jgi:hypothetical protein
VTIPGTFPVIRRRPESSQPLDVASVFLPRYAHSTTAVGIVVGASRDAAGIPSGRPGTHGASPAYTRGQRSRLGTSGIGVDVAAGTVVRGGGTDVMDVADAGGDDGAAPDRAPAAEHALASTRTTNARTQPVRCTGPQSH